MGANGRRLFLSNWFAGRGDSVSAVHYAARAGDHEQALEIATACSESFLLSHNVDALARLRPMLPAGAISSSARLGLVYAWVHAVRGQFGLSREIIAEIPERESPAAARKFALEGFIACGEGDVDQAEAAAHRALAMERQLSPHAQVMIMLVLSSVARARCQFTQARDWNRKAGHGARHLADYGCESLVVYDHARTELAKGNLDRAMQMLQSALEQSQLQAGQSPSAARSRLFLSQALIAWYWGEWELCEGLLGQGLPEAERVGDVAALLGLCIRAMLCHARGNSHGAFVTIGQAERLMQYWKVDTAAYRAVLELLKISLWVECADRDRARSLLVLLETTEKQPMPELFPSLPGLQQVLIIRARLKAGDIDRGLELLDILQNQQRNQPPLAGQALYTMLLKAHAHQLKGAGDKALRLLRRSLDLAAEENYISPVIELQQELAPLLRQLFSHVDDSAYYQRLRRRLTIDLRPAPAAPVSPSEVISDRELAVLELIAQGLSNQQIGDRLHISLHTVKTHARKINVKLGVRSRTQAIVRARELSYL